MTRQEIFNKVADHLLTQQRVAVRQPPIAACAYRSVDGATCAVGCLIPDELYLPEMEGKTVATLLDVFSDLPDYFYVNQHLLADLQIIHDGGIGRESQLSKYWYRSLMSYAEYEDLEPSEKMKEFSAKLGNLESA